MGLWVSAGQFRLTRGKKSGLHRAKRLLTAARRKPMESATETSLVEKSTMVKRGKPRLEQDQIGARGCSPVIVRG